MNVNFEYQDPAVGRTWHTITRTLDIDCLHIHETLKSLTRQFPGCHLRALDDKGQVLETLRT